MTGKGSSNPRRVDDDDQGRASRRRAKPKTQAQQAVRRSRASSRRATEGENMAVLAESQGKLGFPFYFPALRKTGSRYADTKPRIYAHPRRARQAAPAYRLVLYAGAYGEYYGVQGMTLAATRRSSTTRTASRDVDGRKLMLYYDGSHLRLVAWRTAEGRLLGHEHADACRSRTPG